jgi:hypothetical protein
MWRSVYLMVCRNVAMDLLARRLQVADLVGLQQREGRMSGSSWNFRRRSSRLTVRR